jgi:hypothetical protein
MGNMFKLLKNTQFNTIFVKSYTPMEYEFCEKLHIYCIEVQFELLNSNGTK